MSEGSPPAGDLDALAAELRADSSDLRVFFQVLCSKLADDLPHAVTLEREPGMFKKHPQVRRLTVRLGGDTFTAEQRADDTISWHQSHAVLGVGGGMPFARDLDVNDWLRALVDVVDSGVHGTDATAAALRSLVT